MQQLLYEELNSEPLVWYSEDLDAAVLELKPPTDHNLPGCLSNPLKVVNRESKIHLIGHSNSQYKSVNLCCEMCPLDHPEFVKLRRERGEEIKKNCPDLMNPNMILFKSTFLPGSSGSPGFDGDGNLVLMLTCGVHDDSEFLFRQGVSMQAVNDRLQAEGLHFW